MATPHEIKVVIGAAGGGDIHTDPEVLLAEPDHPIIWSFYCCHMEHPIRVEVEFKEQDSAREYFFKPDERHRQDATTRMGKARLIGTVPNVGNMPPLQEDRYTVRAYVNGKLWAEKDPKIIKGKP